APAGSAGGLGDLSSGRREGDAGAAARARPLGEAPLRPQRTLVLGQGGRPRAQRTRPTPVAIMTEREFAVEVVRKLHDAGHQALWAGGCVRDELLGLVPKDYDVATDARPEQVRKMFRGSVPVGAKFGVIKVLGPKTDSGYLMVEVATFRSDVSYSD